jgi:hypothetical protein
LGYARFAAEAIRLLIETSESLQQQSGGQIEQINALLDLKPIAVR